MAVDVISDLVFDVGMHVGEDTDYYLRKGFRVVAFEANPKLVTRARTRFASAMNAGRLTLVEGAISDTSADSVTFYEHPAKSVWGTTDPAWADRNNWRGTSRKVEVPAVRFAQEINRHGMPHYLKVDIEGADRICLDSLSQFSVRPTFLSIESEKRDFQKLLDEFQTLERLGYNSYAVRQQEGISWRPFTIRTLDGSTLSYTFSEGASGPCCDDVDGWTTKAKAVEKYKAIFRWYRVIGDHSRIGRSKPGWMFLKALSRAVRRPLPGWFDTHATRNTLLY